ncbi:ANTAR domain-containing protein [Streptomyces sp. TR06-5]|uniref:ANTAR domain-containing protein n=1 Tax=unclassified Streptomyces TaxID=2593676 RepID=UPI0039A37D8E
MAEETLYPVSADVVRLPGQARGSVWLLRPEGEIGSADHPLFTLAVQPPPESRAVAMDLTAVTLMSVRGQGGLQRCARQVAASGRTLHLATADSRLVRALESRGVLDAFDVQPDVQKVFESCAAGSSVPATSAPPIGGPPVPAVWFSDGSDAGAGTGPAGASQELHALRAEVRNLRAKARTHPLIDQSLGVLMERYGLPGPRTAFELLRRCSQAYNVRLRTLAAALVADPRGELLTTAVAEPPPRLSFLEHDDAVVNSGLVVNAVLQRTLDIVGTGRGSVQLVDPLTGAPRVEVYEGLTEEVVDVLDRGGRDGDTPGALAVRCLARVTVTDLHADPGLPDRASGVLLAAGCRALHCTPLTDGQGAVVGVAEAYLPGPGRVLASGQARALDEMGAEAGRWLTWHRNTVVRDALKYLHVRAPGCRDGVPG